MNRPDTTNQKRTLVFATNNPHKLDEMRQIVGDAFVLYSLDDIGCKDDIPENEETLEGNALAKARWIKSRYGYDCFADDTGLEVEALGGAPGVRSARYASESGHDSAANMKLLLSNMAGKENRNARFRTAIALIIDGREHTFEGIVNGTIAEAPSGTAGFGYDPVFVPEGYNLTFAELSAEQKNAVSHRSRASKAMMAFLAKDSEKNIQII